MSLGWQVLAAARERERGGMVEDMLRVVEQTRQKLSQVVLLDSLKFLHRGGRIGTAKRLLGSVLNIKPLVKINHEEGVVEAAGQTRTREKGIEMLIERFLEGVHSAASLRIAVLHGNVEQEAQEIIQHLKDRYNPREILSNITGPVLGVNTGPRALALCGYSEEPLS